MAIAYYYRGNAHGEKGETAKAIADYTEAVRLNPKHTNTYFNRGVTYRQQGEANKAIADFTEAIRLDTKYVRAYYYRGNAYWNKGEADKAISDYTEAIRLNPKDADFYYNRGIAYGETESKTRPSLTLLTPSDSIRKMPTLTTTAVSHTWTGGRPTKLLPISRRLSGSTRKTSNPTSTVLSASTREASIKPSPTTQRLFGATPNTLSHT